MGGKYFTLISAVINVVTYKKGHFWEFGWELNHFTLPTSSRWFQPSWKIWNWIISQKIKVFETICHTICVNTWNHPVKHPEKNMTKKPMKFHLIAGFFVLQAQQNENLLEKATKSSTKKNKWPFVVFPKQNPLGPTCVFGRQKTPLRIRFCLQPPGLHQLNIFVLRSAALPTRKNLHLGACIHGFACRKFFVHRCIQHRFLEKKTVQKCPSDSWFADDFKIQVNERSWL